MLMSTICVYSNYFMLHIIQFIGYYVYCSDVLVKYDNQMF